MRLRLTLMVAIGIAFAATATPSSAAEILLFDAGSCSGPYRMSDRSIPDLGAIDFDNATGSLLVRSGAWAIYADAGYQQNSAPGSSIGLANYCWSFQASGGMLPDNSLSSILLDSETAGAGPAGVALIYDGANFTGSYRILTESVADFAQVEFDNAVGSLRVNSGTWTFFRDAGYGSPPGRPSITFGPNTDVTDLNQASSCFAEPGPNCFPADLMSSAQVTGMTPPPQIPPMLQCAAGEVASPDGVTCVRCADYGAVDVGAACGCPRGTAPSGFVTVAGVQVPQCGAQCSAPDQVVDTGGGGSCRTCADGTVAGADNQTCVCRGGYFSVGTARNGDQVCQRQTGGEVDMQQPSCPGANQVTYGPGCLECPLFTEPNASRSRCVCLPGHLLIGIDNHGQDLCNQPSGSQDIPPPQLVQVTVPSREAYLIARDTGFTFLAENIGRDANDRCNIDYDGGLTDEAAGNLVIHTLNRIVGLTLADPPAMCLFSLFGGRAPAAGWRIADLRAVSLCPGGIRRQTFADGQIQVYLEMTGLADLTTLFGNPCVGMYAAIEMKLEGPAGANWRSAFR